MTYSPNKPDAGPSPSIDVSQIQTNFSQFDTIFSNNHTALNDLNQGAHEAVVFTLQVFDPGVTEDLAVLYSKNASSRAGTQPQLFAQIPTFLPTKQDTTAARNTGMQLTYNSVNTSGPIYHSFLPGGYILYSGVDSGVTVPSVQISDTIILSPAPTKVLIAIATPVGQLWTVATAINTVTNDRFTINSIGNGNGPAIPYSFVWIAIGKA